MNAVVLKNTQVLGYCLKKTHTHKTLLKLPALITSFNLEAETVFSN